ncbi:MAG TPA: molybdopterin-dependent oxidoreductase [Candidatus Limnocylindrales bacterium]|nr:molybdopterin-dependent oxidoreductase [Candidatus Limnocylindrales bacterium]
MTATTVDSTTPTPAEEPRPAAARIGVAFAALAGVAATAAALGVSELAAGLLGAQSLVAAVGGFVIANQPPGAKDFVVALFGQNDKLALELLIVAVALVIGAVLGVLARHWYALAAAGIAAFAGFGFVAALGDPSVSAAPQAIVAAAGAMAGIWTLSWLFGRAPAVEAASSAGASSLGMPNWSRRGFLIRSGSVAAASVVAGVAGRSLLTGASAAPSTGGTTVPPPAESAVLPTGAELDVDGITPIVVPNDRFYRIDTALIAPTVDLATWALTIKGMVDRQTVLSYADLAELPIVEQYVTIACVSNEVGGNLVGNAKWTGVRLREVLDIAGVQPGATQLVGRSVDGWTAGMPTEWVMDPSREPMIALEMNDEPLPRAHGFPARLIVPGLYGYVSATKWLAELELTTWEGFDGYWVPLGWSKEAPILTQSRIDVPRSGGSVPAGRVAIAGVAWAPDRGISKVEIAIDGEWRDCQLSTPISGATWVQWTYAWDAAASGPGSHTIEVRATDGAGEVQTDAVTPPAPDGARGHHRITAFVA